jgi:hypothetical protein
MPSGRPPKPLKFHEISGAMAKNPQRFRDRGAEPTVEQRLGDPPADWVSRSETSPEYRKLVAAWKKITARIAMLPDGVVTAADDLGVELACRLLVRIEGGYAKTAEISQYRALLSELGLTATGRARLAGPKQLGEPEDGDFGAYVRKPARRTA